MATLAQSTSAAAISAAFASPVTAGDLIIVVVAAADLSKAKVKTPGTQYAITLIGPVQGSGVQLMLALWRFAVTAPLTVVVDGVTSASIVMLDFTPATVGSGGVASFSFLGSSTSTGTGTTADPGSRTDAYYESGTLIVAAAALSAAATVTPASGYTAGPGQGETSGNAGIATQYKIGATGWTQDAPFTLSASQAWAAISVEFFENSSQDYIVS